MKAQAIIFDMNGVIIDDERYHKQAWRMFCEKHGLVFSDKDFATKYQGRTNEDIVKMLVDKDLNQKEVDALVKERISLVEEMYKGNIPDAEGLQEFLVEAQKAHIKMAVATSSPKYYVDEVLQSLGITHFFQAVVTSNDVQKGKPDPAIYLLAAEKLGMKPEDCIVFEDSISGVRAGKAAGMKVLAIPTTRKPEELEEADHIVYSFQGLTVEELERLGL